MLSIIDAEQKLISRELDQNRIMSPTLNQQNPLYAPETGETFQLKTYWIPAEKTHFFVSDNVYAKTEERMIEKIGGKNISG